MVEKGESKKGKLIYEYQSGSPLNPHVVYYIFLIPIQMIIISLVIIFYSIGRELYPIFIFVVLTELIALPYTFAVKYQIAKNGPFKIYENGLISPIRSLSQYRNNEMNYLPFNKIQKIEEIDIETERFDKININIKMNNKEFNFLFGDCGRFDGISKLKSILEEKVPYIWKNRQIIEKKSGWIFTQNQNIEHSMLRFIIGSGNHGREGTNAYYSKSSSP